MLSDFNYLFSQRNGCNEKFCEFLSSVVLNILLKSLLNIHNAAIKFETKLIHNLLT